MSQKRSGLGTPIKWWGVVLSGVLHSILLTLSLPPVGVWPLAFLTVIPLIYAGCACSRRPVLGGFLAALGTLPLWFYQSAWLINVTQEGYPGLAAYLAVFPGLFVFLIAVARRVDWAVPMWILAPVLWVMLEVFRGEISLTGYAWYLLAHPLIDAPALAAPASILGVYGVSLLVAALGGAVADASGWSGIRRSAGGVGAVVTIVAWTLLALAGRPAAEGPSARDLVAGVVQTNIPQSNKLGWSMADKLKDFERFGELSRLAAAGPPGPVEADVVIWPETMFPGWVLNPEAVQAERRVGLVYKVSGPMADRFVPPGRVPGTYFADELVKLQQSLGVPLLVGSITADGDYERWLLQRLGPEDAKSDSAEALLAGRYNSALVILDGKVQARRYDKIELTPFGEMIPYVWRLPKLQQWVLSLGAQGMTFDLGSGQLVAGLDVPVGGRNVRMATPICFEATRADLCRRLVRGDGTGRSAVLINLSNDGWFTHFESGRAQHLLATRWRCVELSVPMIRSVNTGYSAAIDRRGVVTALRLMDQDRPRANVDGVLLASVRIEPERSSTIFERIGLIPAYTLSLVGLVGSGILLIRRRRLIASGA